ncbi:MAG: hypothetical protein US62_C0012G0009 [Candidatus Woesebacteria bacterium GW2011_GWA1_37_8]|uniref:Uncharacterized protein n=2 Tax=Candidatus Woeseibacteriota TaxID=1752722 RepID=A0A0G0LFV2_9BACT|nr:MAG: hypothetical protein US39_C0017G0013 [Microgenomates group bacterium GW2011_GWC1_37_12b]KKQ45595.1 MAG: hypothetical protein US62_C0012G0009 [Candidatus Woesebacteria bacterium GW2011_GWA1_37_8]KKQ86815.1 MAG: hypothetical protein UT10_C0016G0009 [Candidatus Woesebacteria bacterium GW2011_GWB1_38_8b]
MRNFLAPIRLRSGFTTQEFKVNVVKQWKDGEPVEPSSPRLTWTLTTIMQVATKNKEQTPGKKYQI